MARQLIAATVSQTESAEFRMTDREVPASLFTSGNLLGSEVVHLEQSTDGGSTWFDTGDANDLTLGEQSRCIECRGIYRVNKDATVNAVGVFMSDGNDDL